MCAATSQMEKNVIADHVTQLQLRSVHFTCIARSAVPLFGLLNALYGTLVHKVVFHKAVGNTTYLTKILCHDRCDYSVIYKWNSQ